MLNSIQTLEIFYQHYISIWVLSQYRRRNTIFFILFERLMGQHACKLCALGPRRVWDGILFVTVLEVKFQLVKLSNCSFNNISLLMLLLKRVSISKDTLISHTNRMFFQELLRGEFRVEFYFLCGSLTNYCCLPGFPVVFLFVYWYCLPLVIHFSPWLALGQDHLACTKFSTAEPDPWCGLWVLNIIRKSQKLPGAIPLPLTSFEVSGKSLQQF